MVRSKKEVLGFSIFYIGAHFHPSTFQKGDAWEEDYRNGILYVVNTIHEHSPDAKIIIALTTPSPLDSNATHPADDGSCGNMHTFHPTGFVSNMDGVIRSIASSPPSVLEEGQEKDDETNTTSIISNVSPPPPDGLWAISDRYSFIMPTLNK